MTIPRCLYDEQYYRTNCEGWELPPGQLSVRLRSYEGWVDKVFDTGRDLVVMDLGFGRGEITLRMASHKNVRRVVAVDYSSSAGKILLSLMGNDDVVADKVSVVISDANGFLSLLGARINHIVAFDVIEHLLPEQITCFFAHAARLIPEGGKIFIITPITQAPTNDRHVWLVRKPDDLCKLACGFECKCIGHTGSGDDHKFEFTRVAASV